jgi:hypothetical protein
MIDLLQQFWLKRKLMVGFVPTGNPMGYRSLPAASNWTFWLLLSKRNQDHPIV